MKMYDTYREMLRHSGIDPFKMLGIREDFVYHKRSLSDKDWLKTLPKNYDPKFLRFAHDQEILESMIADERQVISEYMSRRASNLPLFSFISDSWKIAIIVALLVGANYLFKWLFY